MEIAEKIQTALNNGKVVIGFRMSLKFVKTNEPKALIVANNIPEIMLKQLEDAIKNYKVKIEVFNGDSTSLGIACGKPFPISTIVITA